MRNEDALIARFLRYVEQAGENDLFEADAPSLLCTKPLADWPGMFQWTFRRTNAAPWIPALESSIRVKLPATYRHLVTNYLFPAFEVDRVKFWANTGTTIHDEFVEAITRDAGRAKPLLGNGFLQIGQGGGGADYDPVCLDTLHGTGQDAPLVKLDHEELLLRGRIKEVHRIAPSLERFMLNAIS